MLFCQLNFKNTLLLCLFGLFAINTSTAAAVEKYNLRAKIDHNIPTRVKASLDIKGHLKFMVNQKIEQVAMIIKSDTLYDEKQLKNSMVATEQKKTIRFYHRADADLVINGNKIHKKLRDKLRYIGVESTPEKVTLHSVEGLLSRDELDLISLPADNTLIDQLLPTQEVAIGDEWAHSNKVLAGMLGLDAASSATVKSTLKSVEGNLAKIHLHGKLDGAINGIATEIELRANYQFDLKQHRITLIALSVEEDRPIGHIGPGIKATTMLKMIIDPITTSTQLSAANLKKIKPISKKIQTLLSDTVIDDKVQLSYDRRWHLIDNDSKRLLMRYVVDGDLVSQCHLTMLPPTKTPGKTRTLAQFRDEVKTSLGDRLTGLVKVSQKSNAQDYRVFRVEAQGTVEKLSIRWIYYFIADKHGNQAVMAFTTEDELMKKLAGADLRLADQLQFREVAAKAPVKKETASKKKTEATTK